MGKEITNEQLFEIITKMYSDLDGKIVNMNKEMQEGFKGMNSKIDGLENEVKKINAKIDHEVMPKIDALFDGYKQNSEKLDRIEKEVSGHEEIIFRRIK